MEMVFRMNANFSRILALLRKEKGISQRKAASDLGISQALLSHYENGAREPGLAFVVRACDYYHVSADFLLGRSLSREGTTIVDADTLYDASEERDNALQGSVLAILSKKLLINTLSVLFDLLGRMGNKQAIRGAANYLSEALYLLFRAFYMHSADYKEDLFSVSRVEFSSGLPTADMLLSLTEYADALEESAKEGKIPCMSHEELTQRYPGAYQSMMQILHTCGARMNRQLSLHKKEDK